MGSFYDKGKEDKEAFVRKGADGYSCDKKRVRQQNSHVKEA